MKLLYGRHALIIPNKLAQVFPEFSETTFSVNILSCPHTRHTHVFIFLYSGLLLNSNLCSPSYTSRNHEEQKVYWLILSWAFVQFSALNKQAIISPGPFKTPLPLSQVSCDWLPLKYRRSDHQWVGLLGLKWPNWGYPLCTTSYRSKISSGRKSSPKKRIQKVEFPQTQSFLKPNKSQKESPQPPSPPTLHSEWLEELRAVSS